MVTNGKGKTAVHILAAKAATWKWYTALPLTFH